MKVTSKNNVPIRLTNERWAHITESHDYMAGCMDYVLETIDDPDYIVGGPEKELIALRYYQDLGKHVVVVYKEVSANDGFVITSFITSKYKKILEGEIKWRKS